MVGSRQGRAARNVFCGKKRSINVKQTRNKISSISTVSAQNARYPPPTECWGIYSSGNAKVMRVIEVREMTGSGDPLSWFCHLVCSDILEVGRPAVFLGEEVRTGEELPGLTAGAFG